MTLIQAWDEAMDCREYSINNNEYSVNVNKDKKELVIAIMGSWQKSDWISNFLFFKIPYKNMKIKFWAHYGFTTAYHSIRDKLLAEVLPLYKEGYKIKIRAYSRGSGIGYLVHEDILFHTGEQPDTIMFGSPRAFSIWNYKELKSRLSNIKRIENGNDLVCHVPPWIMGFKHYGKTVHVGEKRKWWKYSVKDHANYRSVLT